MKRMTKTARKFTAEKIKEGRSEEPEVRLLSLMLDFIDGKAIAEKSYPFGVYKIPYKRIFDTVSGSRP